MKKNSAIKTRRVSERNVNYESRLTRDSLKQQQEWEQFWQDNDNVPSAARYNLTISNAPRFIWYRNAKVATRTVFHTLLEAGVKFEAAQARRCYYSAQRYQDHFKFAFVRNPWDRLVSAWQNQVVRLNGFDFDPATLEKMQSFENFVDYCANLDLSVGDAHIRHQSRLIDLNELDYLGRLEQFDDDLREIFRILALPIERIPVRNSSKRGPNYRRYYNERTQTVVSGLYRKDIQLFGYSF